MQGPHGEQSAPFSIPSQSSRRLFFGSSKSTDDDDGGAHGTNHHEGSTGVHDDIDSVMCSLDVFDDPTHVISPASQLFCRCCTRGGTKAHALDEDLVTCKRMQYDQIRTCSLPLLPTHQSGCTSELFLSSRRYQAPPKWHIEKGTRHRQKGKDDSEATCSSNAVTTAKVGVRTVWRNVHVLRARVAGHRLGMACTCANAKVGRLR